MEFTKEEIARFHDKYAVNTETGCWEWTGPKYANGYAMFYRWRGHKGRRTFSSHRISWSLHSGLDIPPKMVICHKCDVRHCVNPDHLFLGTSRDNNLDTVKKGRANRTVGSSCSWAKLTEEAVMEIYATNGFGSQKMLAEKFGVGRGTISLVKKGIRWKHMYQSLQNAWR